MSKMAPYIRGLNEKFRNTCNKVGIQVHLKGHNTVQTFLMAPKVKDNMCQKSGVIYHYRCSHTDCPEQYIGEPSRMFGDSFREQLMVLSPIRLYSQTT